MSLWLYELVRVFLRERRWVHIQEIAAAGHVLIEGQSATYRGDYAYLRHWGLCAQKTKGRNISGMWKPTKKGYLFVTGRIKVPAWVIRYYKNELIEWAEELVSFEDTMEEGFDFDKLEVDKLEADF